MMTMTKLLPIDITKGEFKALAKFRRGKAPRKSPNLAEEEVGPQVKEVITRLLEYLIDTAADSSSDSVVSDIAGDAQVKVEELDVDDDEELDESWFC